jgi:hypothetical protein
MAFQLDFDFLIAIWTYMIHRGFTFSFFLESFVYRLLVEKKSYV